MFKRELLHQYDADNYVYNDTLSIKHTPYGRWVIMNAFGMMLFAGNSLQECESWILYNVE